MGYQRNPDISIRVPNDGLVGNDVKRFNRPYLHHALGNRIDKYLSEQGVRISEMNVEDCIRQKMEMGGEATYHVKGATVLIGTRLFRDIHRCFVDIYIEGTDKSKLVKELEEQLAEFKIPAKV